MSNLTTGTRVTVEWPLNNHHGRRGTITAVGTMQTGPFRDQPACHVRYNDAKSKLPGAANSYWIPARFLVADAPEQDAGHAPGGPA